MDIEDLFTDEAKENEGVWVDAGEYLPDMEGIQLKVARMLNPAFVRMLSDEQRKAGPKYDTDVKLQTEVNVRVFAHTILRGWKGLTSKGEPVKYSVQKAEEYLARSTDLRNLCTRISQDRQQYRASQEEADRKN